MSGTEDRLLIERSLKGDREAFDSLVRKHERRAYQYAFRLTNNPEEAADVVADTFVRVYGALHNFKGTSAFSTWLYRILTNCFLDLKKRERSRTVASLDTSSADEHFERQVEDEGPGPAQIAERDERERVINQAVQQLPEYQRAMIVMHHAENLSYEEIAEALDLPIGTVKSRLNRARISLRDLLAKDEELFRV